MRGAPSFGDHVVGDGMRAVTRRAFGESSGVTEAEHELAGRVHVVEHDAGRRVLVGQRSGAVMRVGIGRSREGANCKRHETGARK